MADADDASTTNDANGPDVARRGAFRGAFAAGFLVLLAAAIRDIWDVWLLIAAALALPLSFVLAGHRQTLTRRLLGTRSRLPTKEVRQPGLADAVLAHIPDPVILVDQRTLVIEANAAARVLLPGLKTGHPLSFALRSPDVLGAIDEVLGTGAPLRIEYSERIPTERTFEVHIGPLSSDEPGISFGPGVVLFFRDLTSARRLEAMRADFVANASHELRTPLASLLGFIETLQGPARDDPKARERFLDIMRGQAQRMKRLIDLVIGIVGLVPLAVAVPFVLVGDLLANRGPLFYTQQRVGRGGQTFEILKFRSMRPAASGGEAATTDWTSVDDPRVTAFGRVLRASHLDELPQVLNIVRGDLSVVGPRPEQPRYVTELSASLPFYGMRHLVRPGLTGWAQVKYGYAGDEDDALEKLQYEFFYLRHQSLRFDLRVMGRTVRSVLGSEGKGR